MSISKSEEQTIIRIAQVIIGILSLVLAYQSGYDIKLGLNIGNIIMALGIGGLGIYLFTFIEMANTIQVNATTSEEIKTIVLETSAKVDEVLKNTAKPIEEFKGLNQPNDELVLESSKKMRQDMKEAVRDAVKEVLVLKKLEKQ